MVVSSIGKESLILPLDISFVQFCRLMICEKLSQFKPKHVISDPLAFEWSSSRDPFPQGIHSLPLYFSSSPLPLKMGHHGLYSYSSPLLTYKNRSVSVALRSLHFILMNSSHSVDLELIARHSNLAVHINKADALCRRSEHARFARE